MKRLTEEANEFLEEEGFTCTESLTEFVNDTLGTFLFGDAVAMLNEIGKHNNVSVMCYGSEDEKVNIVYSLFKGEVYVNDSIKALLLQYEDWSGQVYEEEEDEG